MIQSKLRDGQILLKLKDYLGVVLRIISKIILFCTYFVPQLSQYIDIQSMLFSASEEYLMSNLT